MSEFNTPMMKQYEEIKKQYPDCLLLYRLGDFYELFMEDAHIGAKVLDLTLTGRPRGKDGRIPMAGVPFHAVDSYLAKLVKAGYKVAICEQVSEPDTHGIVEREVVRIVTPGTVLDEKTLNRKENNYIVSIAMDAHTLGIACADISTGQFMTSEFPIANYEHTIVNELSRINPVECILTKKLYDNPALLKLLKLNQDINIFCFQNWDTYAANPISFLTKHFKIKSLMSYDISHKQQAQLVSAALLGYLKETQRDKVDHFKTISSLVSDEHMLLDRSTITNLELFTTLRNGDKRGSLMEVIDHTVTAMGARMIRQWARKPLNDRNKITERLDAVENIFTNNSVHVQLKKIMEEVTDIERTISRLSVGIGNARDMVSLKNSLNHIFKVKLILENISGSLPLQTIASNIASEILEIASLIDKFILDDPRFDPKEGRIIKDGIDDSLDQLRKIVNHGNEWVLELESKERERTGISSLKVRFNKVFGFYIEVSNSNLNSVPDNYTRKQTLVNGERFITPELKKQEEIILTAEEKLNKLEYSIYLNVLTQVINSITPLQQAAASIAELDCILSFATLAHAGHYSESYVE
ncbi:MAG: DNA mismatch repair protein MutS [bacterium]|nr:DNA mismatch repair protein MutS [bacterium]